MKSLLIDTNVFIDYLRGKDNASRFIESVILNDTKCYTSTITIAELYAGVRDGKEQQVLDRFLRGFEIIPIDGEIARTGGLYRRDYSKSHGVCIADALIAACAVINDLQLVTLNKKHFPMLKNIKVPY